MKCGARRTAAACSIGRFHTLFDISAACSSTVCFSHHANLLVYSALRLHLCGHLVAASLFQPLRIDVNSLDLCLSCCGTVVCFSHQANLLLACSALSLLLCSHLVAASHRFVRFVRRELARPLIAVHVAAQRHSLQHNVNQPRQPVCVFVGLFAHHRVSFSLTRSLSRFAFSRELLSRRLDTTRAHSLSPNTGFAISARLLVSRTLEVTCCDEHLQE